MGFGSAKHAALLLNAVLLAASVAPGLAAPGPGPLTARGGEVAWALGLEPLRVADAAHRALAAGDWLDAAQAAAGMPAPALPVLEPLPLAGLERQPEEVRAVLGQLAAVVGAAPALAEREGPSAAALAILAALASAQGPLGIGAASAPSDPPGLDVMPVRHALQMIQEARLQGKPFYASGAGLKSYEDWFVSQSEPPSSDESNERLHAAVHAPLPHAVEHASHMIHEFHTAVEAFALASGGVAAAASPCGVTGDVLVETPGCEVIVGGPGPTTYDASSPLLAAAPASLIVDLAGADTYLGPAAGALPGQVRVLLDLAGSDSYAAMAMAAQGGAMEGGVAVLLDASGNDAYVTLGEDAAAAAQGGTFGGGAGILVDLAGDDSYALVNVHEAFSHGEPIEEHLVSEASRLVGQGGALGGGLGVLLDATGSDFYGAFAASQAVIPMFDPYDTNSTAGLRPNGANVTHTTTSGEAVALVQGAGDNVAGERTGPSVGVHVDAANPPLLGRNEYFAFAVSLSQAWEYSVLDFGSRTCIGTSGGAVARAQGAGANGGLGVHATNAETRRFAEAVSMAVGECYEVGSGVDGLMHSESRAGGALAQSQGAGVDGGLGGLLQAGGLGENLLFADSISVSCSQCFLNTGQCNGVSTTGEAVALGQGAAEGGTGVLLSLGLDDIYAAGAFEGGNAWAVAAPPNVTVSVAFASPSPSARVQGYASGGVGALVDVAGTDTYDTMRPWDLFQPPETVPDDYIPPSAVGRGLLLYGDDFYLEQEFAGLDLDKGVLGGSGGLALLADLSGLPDSYVEYGFPLSGAADGSAWGAGPSSLVPLAVEQGVDA